MDGFLEVSRDVAVWAGTIAWAVVVVAAGLSILVSLPGGWVALGLVVLWDLFHGFEVVGFARLGIFLGLLIVGEIVEALLGSLYVARRGATRWGVAGTFVGGIVGAALGTGWIPVVGTLVGAFAGAFAGAVAGELVADKRLEPSLRIGAHATLGRLLAVGVKSLLAAVGIGLSLVAVFSALAGAGA